MHPSHTYGTRTRKSSLLKPTPRTRQSPHPPPRRIRPVPVPVTPTPHPCLPVFPLPGVMLHPEDASNKVFHAIGRSFLSVVSSPTISHPHYIARAHTDALQENRAMTIKDLAEMTLSHGLMCQKYVHLAIFHPSSVRGGSPLLLLRIRRLVSISCRSSDLLIIVSPLHPRPSLLTFGIIWHDARHNKITLFFFGTFCPEPPRMTTLCPRCIAERVAQPTRPNPTRKIRTPTTKTSPKPHNINKKENG